MRAILPLLILTVAGGAPALHAQVDYNARLGVTWATTLIRDNVINVIEVRQKLAPTLVLGAALPIAPLYRSIWEQCAPVRSRWGWMARSREAFAGGPELGSCDTGPLRIGGFFSEAELPGFSREQG